MVVCPTCQHQELYGALYCSECGAELFQLEVSPPQTAVYPSQTAPRMPTAMEFPYPAASQSNHAGEARIFLKMIDNGQVVPLEGGDEFTLGRVSGNQPILPDLDLTPHRAYEGGVSRLHATIKITADGVMVTDLGSANGTRLNGKKITAHQPYSLKHEDVLSLGKFKIQVLIQA